MRNCTNHFNTRWVERIVGLKEDREIKEYITKNKDMISEHANVTFEYSEHIYKGQIGDNVTRNYHIKDDIIFITNTTDDAFITCYKIDLGFTDEINSSVRKGLVKEIHHLAEEKNEIEFTILQEVENKEHIASNLAEEIKIAELQLQGLKNQKEFIQQEVKSIRSKSLNVGLDLKKYTLMLVNSIEYKKDLVSMK